MEDISPLRWPSSMEWLTSARIDTTCWAASGVSHATNVELDLINTPALITEMRTCYLGERDPRTPLASPLYADLQGLPPLLITSLTFS